MSAETHFGDSESNEASTEEAAKSMLGLWAAEGAAVAGPGRRLGRPSGGADGEGRSSGEQLDDGELDGEHELGLGRVSLEYPRSQIRTPRRLGPGAL